MENHSHQNEEGKSDQLRTQPGDHDCVSLFNSIGIPGSLHRGSHNLTNKRADVNYNVDFRGPARVQHSVVCSIESANEAAKSHVDGRCEKRRGRQDEHELYEVRTTVSDIG